MLPVLLQIGSFKIYSMGLLMAGGLIASLYWWWKMGRDEHWDEISLFDVYFLSLAAFFIFGRIGYVLGAQEVGSWTDRLSLLFRPGLNYMIGLAGSMIMTTLAARAKGWEVWKVWDSMVVAMAMALLWGNIGTWFSRGELWLDTWGVVWAVLTFVATTLVRKNFRFYSWYKGDSSVAQDGLTAIMFLALVSFYYLVRGAMGQNWWIVGMGVAGILVAGLGLKSRSGKGKTSTIKAVSWINRPSLRRKRRQR